MYARPHVFTIAYLFPNQNVERDVIILTELTKAHLNKDFLIVGDFNARNIDWETWNVSGLKDTFDHRLLEMAGKKNILPECTVRDTR
ncbi:unnamed protein product [Schistocephalus solidus]|uniref:Endo/exonuclease/phosphatase domain-containing protein n=1 Tax=Schistocephalus solidus TaxID=70667 RepID=A0A183TRG6_SCHSO|nr:unnamed protein product [Schistocephalus solidus]